MSFRRSRAHSELQKLPTKVDTQVKPKRLAANAGHLSSSEQNIPINSRPALVTIQHNIRRQKSRLGLLPEESSDDEVAVGSKRKRNIPANENGMAPNPATSHMRSAKRFKVSNSPVQSDAEPMDTDEEDDEDSQQSIDYYLFEASQATLARRKKDHLVELYNEAHPPTRSGADPDQLTRQELISAILVARKRPRRPTTKRTGSRLPRRVAPYTPDSDDYQGKSHPTRGGLRRNATETGTHAPQISIPLGRSFSLNTLDKHAQLRYPNNRGRVNSIESISSSVSDHSPPPITPISPPITRKHAQLDQKNKLFPNGVPSLSETDQLPTRYEPSPRRLRSRTAGTAPRMARRLPERSAKAKVGSLLEEDEEDEFEDYEEDQSGDENERNVPASVLEDSDAEVESVLSEPEEPPLRTRQRSSKRAAKVRIATPPSEDESMRTDNSEDDAEGEEDDGDNSSPRRLRNGKVLKADEQENDQDSESEPSESGDTEYVEDEKPRKRRTRKQVSEDEEDEEDEEAEEDEQQTEDEDVDLEEATAKSLGRYRRDDLVRFCETRELDVEGTKPQLVKALLEWRDSHQPSSSGASTVRALSSKAPSTMVPKRKRPPVLERSDRVHVEQPRTPPVSEPPIEAGKTSEDGDLEIDLELLGLEDKEIPIEKLVKKEKIGSGGFKDVYSGTMGSRKVAISEFRGQLTSMDVRELQLLRDLHHDNIVHFYGVSVPENTKETPVVMITELCANGDLFDYIRNEKPPPFSRIIRLMHDIASGLEYLHKHKPSIIHRDCKSSNILITRAGRGKIADFGLARVKQSTRSMIRSLVGTVNWQAPELWHAHPKYDHKVDVFSCAMVFWEILQWHLPNKKYPWEGMNEHAIYDAVGSKKQRPPVAGLRKQWGPEVVELIEEMWAQDPRDRPSMTEVVAALENIPE